MYGIKNQTYCRASQCLEESTRTVREMVREISYEGSKPTSSQTHPLQLCASPAILTPNTLQGRC